MGHMGSRQGYSGASLKLQDKGRSPGTLLNVSLVKKRHFHGFSPNFLSKERKGSFMGNSSNSW